MAEGIKDKVAIIGMGCTTFGEHWDKSGNDLMVESFKECLEDAGIEKKQIDAAWFGACFPMNGLSGLPLSQALKLPFVPVTHVENFCATGSEALRGAAYAVASGAADVALALGMEKLKDTGYGGLPDIGSSASPGETRWVMPNMTAPGAFAMMATRYFATYGLSPEEGKTALAKISVKSHANGIKNPRAHLRRPVTVEQAVNAPIVAWPLGLFDCCGVSDGSAAAIVVRADQAKKYRQDPVNIKAMQIAISSGEEQLGSEWWDGAHVETTVRASQRAYLEAGIKNPREELSMMETHDCFSITELTEYEDLGISPRGKAKEDIDAGFFEMTGKIPCQPDGGLKCFGHPIGASGLRMTYEMYKQLQGKCGERQIKDPKLGLTHNMGGWPAACVVSCFVFGQGQ